MAVAKFRKSVKLGMGCYFWFGLLKICREFHHSHGLVKQPGGQQAVNRVNTKRPGGWIHSAPSIRVRHPPRPTLDAEYAHAISEGVRVGSGKRLFRVIVHFQQPL